MPGRRVMGAKTGFNWKTCDQAPVLLSDSKGEKNRKKEKGHQPLKKKKGARRRRPIFRGTAKQMWGTGQNGTGKLKLRKSRRNAAGPEKRQGKKGAETGKGPGKQQAKPIGTGKRKRGGGKT